MVPHALPLSNAALIAANVIGYGLLVLIAIVLWLSSRKHQQPEQLLGLKIIGYLLLAEFTFNLNTWPIPLGFVIAYLLMRRAGINQSTKRAAVLLGGVLFLFHLVPLSQQIDHFMYPRDQMDTYLHKNLDIAKFGFNITIVDEHSLVRQSLFEKDPNSIAFYKALADSKSIPVLPPAWVPVITIELRQDHEQDRFRELQFKFDEQGRYFTLYNGETHYSFESSEAFREIYFTMMAPYLSDKQ
jgi:hypothetical protein